MSGDRECSKDYGLHVYLALDCTESVRKSVVVTPEAVSFRELKHNRHRQYCFTLRTGSGEVLHNLCTLGKRHSYLKRKEKLGKREVTKTLRVMVSGSRGFV